MKKYCYALLAVIMLTSVSCRDNGGDGAADDDAPIEIIRFDRYVGDYAGEEVPDSMTPAVELLKFMSARTGSEFTGLEDYRHSRAYEVFAPDVESRFTSSDSIEAVLGVVDGRMRRLTGDGLGTVYGVIMPFREKVITGDSVIFIGLNHYLGADYAGYQGCDRYVVRANRAAHMPYDVAEARIVADYPMVDDGDMTLLKGMIYWGAVARTVSDIVPGSTLDEVFNLGDGEREWLMENAGKVWKTLIEKQLIYSTDPDVAARLLYPAPKSFLLHGDAPGMTGRYMGYLIVDSYLKNHPEITVADILRNGLYNSESFLVDSGFGVM